VTSHEPVNFSRPHRPRTTSNAINVVAEQSSPPSSQPPISGDVVDFTRPARLRTSQTTASSTPRGIEAEICGMAVDFSRPSRTRTSRRTPSSARTPSILRRPSSSDSSPLGPPLLPIDFERPRKRKTIMTLDSSPLPHPSLNSSGPAHFRQPPEINCKGRFSRNFFCFHFTH
jgi:hypothetical protein